MTIEKLTPEQYPILKDVADGYVPDAANSVAIVAKDGADYVGRILLVALAHVEGTWIREDKRHGSFGLRMWNRMEKEAKEIGLTQLFAYCEPKHDSYMERLGYIRVPVSVWRKEL